MQLKSSAIALTFFCSAALATTPERISSHQHYKDSVEIINKVGVGAVIQQGVEMQRQMMREQGGMLDEFTEVIRVSGDKHGFYQTAIFDLGAVLETLNKSRLKEGKKPLSRKRVMEIAAQQMPRGQATMLCTAPASRALIDHGVTYSMKFTDELGVYIEEVEVDEVMCQSLSD